MNSQLSSNRRLGTAARLAFLFMLGCLFFMTKTALADAQVSLIAGSGTFTQSNYPGISGISGDAVLFKVGDHYEMTFEGIRIGPLAGATVTPIDDGILIQQGQYWAIFVFNQIRVSQYTWIPDSQSIFSTPNEDDLVDPLDH